jgi:hypothetical protein
LLAEHRAAFLHDADCECAVAGGGQGPHQQSVARLAQRIEAHQLTSQTVRGHGLPAAELGLGRDLDRLDLGVGEDAPPRLDPVPEFADEEAARGDGARDERLHQRVWDIALAQRRLPAEECAPASLEVDERLWRHVERVAAGLAADRDVRAGHDAERAPQTADQRVQVVGPGIRSLLPPDRLGQLVAGQRSPTVQHEIRPEPPPLTPRET